MTLAYSANGQNGYNVYDPEQDRDRAPDIDYVLSLFKDYSSYYRPFHQQCQVEEDFYFGRNPIPKAEGHDPVRPATAHAIINVGTDHVDVENIEIDVPSSPRSRARAEKIKKFLQGTWLNVKGPVLRTVVKHTFTYGIGFLKPMWNPDQWPDAPPRYEYITEEGYKKAMRDFMEARCIKFPFVVKNVNPKNLIWDDSRARRQWAIEFYVREVRDIKRRYPEWVTEKKGGQMATWMEYWDERWCGYIADNMWVWGPYEHGYGALPYVAIQASNSLEWDSGPPHERYQGILKPVHGLLETEARIMTAYESILRQYGWRTLDFHGPKEAAEKTRQNYEMFGGKNYIPPNVEVKASPQVTPPPELLQQLNLVQTAIEEATFPNVIRGIRPRGVSSGFGVSVLAGMGRLVFQGVASGMARGLEETNERFLKLLENKAGGKVTVHARSSVHNFDQAIGPEDVKDLYENKVTMKAEAPEEREREALLAMRLYGAQMISLYEAQKRAGIINPLEEQIQMGAERLLQSPDLLAEQSRIAAEGVGLLQQLGDVAGVTSQGGQNLGNQFLPGQTQLQRPGEAAIQRQRVASNQEGQGARVFPQGFGGLDALGARLAGAAGGATNVPSGQTVR